MTTTTYQVRHALRSVRRKSRLVADRLVAPVLGSVVGVHTHERVAALTFDDGPDPASTPHLLDILGRHGARATFFMVGRSAQRHPDILSRAVRYGHAIGNHTWDHAAVPLVGVREGREQIRACERALAPHGCRLFRPPYGFQNPSSYMVARALGYTVVGWSGTAHDWLDHPTEALLDRLVRALHPGCVILLHDHMHHTIADSYADRTALLQAVDTLLDRFSGQYRFITIPELLRYGKARRVAWFRPVKREWLNALNNGMGRQY
jgi:peptidoglycan-N-acetylglucosamine deacetylase